jgi:hypothetical protein
MKIAPLLIVFSLPVLSLTPSDASRHGIMVEMLEQESPYKIELPDRTVLYKTLEPYKNDLVKAVGVTYETTVFDLPNMSDSLYLDKYVFWQEVPVSRGSFFSPMLGDINKNARAELYGFEKLYTTPEFSIHAHIYEQDSTGTFKTAYVYPDSVIEPYVSYDIDRDGSEEVVFRTENHEYEVYRTSGPGSFATVPSFGFNPYAASEQLDDITFGDFDGNGRTDVVYYLSLAQFSMIIGEYNAEGNTIDTVFRFRPTDAYSEGFSVGDFDGDGRTDFVLGSTHGQVYVVEAQGVREYQHVWTGQVETYNAYLHMQTHDIDGNGKPEFWVGGDAYYNGLGETRYTCFESTGNNAYQPVARIDLLGIFSFFAGNCFARDLDGDGKEELFICLDQHVLILKFTGAPNHHQYQMLYMKRNELASQNSTYRGATMEDLTGDGKPELLITMGQVANNQLRQFTRVWKPVIIDDIDENPRPVVPEGFRLFQNYPNPFNSTTVIRFRVPPTQPTSHVRLTVYDLLGSQVKLLLDSDDTPGDHQVRWDGTNLLGESVGSGVYLIRMEAGDFTSTLKALLIK